MEKEDSEEIKDVRVSVFSHTVSVKGDVRAEIALLTICFKWEALPKKYLQKLCTFCTNVPY
ncbi:MAG: hypothetical protein JSW15_05625 [Deltaproteobacteria bacterium]|nr:MAG: hypothetical protein JSW15_05625 [Deltaproteobacteria bacterium]